MNIIVDIKGGLGNQMFGYAFGYAVAKQKNAKLCLDTSMLEQSRVKDRKLELSGYQITYDKCILYPYRDALVFKKLGINRIVKRCAVGLGTRIYREQQNYVYDENVFTVWKDTYFDGFWQNYRYFHSYRKELLEKFTLKEMVEDTVQKLEEEIRKTNSVSLHVRRGDYLSLNWQLPMRYYTEALEIIKERLKITQEQPVSVFVFSDDPAYAKEYFSKHKGDGIEYRFIEYESKYRVLYDMYLMSKCRHHIIANSSYSWWSAYLNSYDAKVVVCPVTDRWCASVYPEKWEKIVLD